MPTTYSLGDTVNCKINYGNLAWANDIEYERIASFYIIGLCDSGYLVLVSSDVFLKNSFILTIRGCKEFDLADKFADSDVHFINDNHVVSVQKRLEGLACLKCEIHFEYAEPNTVDADGKMALVCWSCRCYPIYK